MANVIEERGQFWWFGETGPTSSLEQAVHGLLTISEFPGRAQFLYDLSSSPSALLKPQHAVITPKTQRTKRVMEQLLCSFDGLGRTSETLLNAPSLWEADIAGTSRRECYTRTVRMSETED